MAPSISRPGRTKTDTITSGTIGNHSFSKTMAEMGTQEIMEIIVIAMAMGIIWTHNPTEMEMETATTTITAVADKTATLRTTDIPTATTTVDMAGVHIDRNATGMAMATVIIITTKDAVGATARFDSD